MTGQPHHDPCDIHRSGATQIPTLHEVHPQQTYVERLPAAPLAARLRTVWVQHTGSAPYVQRYLPTGGVELHCRAGEEPRVVGPLTTAVVEVLPPATRLVGVRFWPGAAASLLGLPVDELRDQVVPLDQVWGAETRRLGDAVAAADDEGSIDVLQRHLLQAQVGTAPPDTLVIAAARRLMPWQERTVGDLTSELSISASQLRRRFLATVGVGPKQLQRTLRFQGYLALAQAAASPDPSARSLGVSDLATDLGYADHAHLSRECQRLAGQTPSELLLGGMDRCGCGHDHAASYRPFLRGRHPRPR